MPILPPLNKDGRFDIAQSGPEAVKGTAEKESFLLVRMCDRNVAKIGEWGEISGPRVERIYL